MSLILDALRKLDREKGAPERGLVVLGAPGPQRPRTAGGGVLALALILGGALGGAFALVWLRGPARPAPVAAPALEAARPNPPAQPLASPAATAAATASPAPPKAHAPARPPAASAPAAPPPPAAGEPATATIAAAAPAAEPALDDAAATTPQPSAESAEPPAETGGAAPPEPRLEAISVRDGRPVAILSGRLVFEGDSFDGVQVLRIGASEVEIERDGRRQVLRF
ncbi:MAG: hypothetical protein AB7O37_12760 [Vicinamibacteria bacterium]